MSRSPGRRKSSLKDLLSVNEPPKPLLTFKWSTSASHLAALEDNQAVIFPSIITDRLYRKYFSNSPSITDQHSVSQASISTNSKTSHSSRHTKKSSSPEQEKPSPRGSPLLLSYAQLHRASPPPPARRFTRARLSIYPVNEDKRTSISVVSSKISPIARPSRPSITSTNITLLTPKFEQPIIPEDNLVRLHTPQLRRLNVSDKYINEAKKLYYNANCKVFVPRVGVA